MDILILHGLGPKKNWIKSWEETELFIPKTDSVNNYIIHNCIYDVPNCLKKYRFDAIIMMSTFMDWVKREPLTGPWLLKYDFVKRSDAMKIVYSQDDYWLSEIRDEFCVKFNIDLLLPFCDPESWKELYPNYINRGGKIRQGYTCYLTENMKKLTKRRIPWEQRKIDIVYRASGVPTFPNKFGYIKAQIGNRFLSSLGPETSLVTDISTSQSKFLTGDSWYSFMSNSKAILGSNTGSSVQIRNFDVVKKIEEVRKSFPKIDNYDLEVESIPLVDRNKEFDGISPRNVEAALLGVVQILVKGRYGGLLKPGIHYLELDEDCGNANEIALFLKDEKRCREIVNNCYQAFINFKEMSAEFEVDEILNSIKKHPKDKKQQDKNSFKKLEKVYNRQKSYLTFKYQCKRLYDYFRRKVLYYHLGKK